MISYKPPKESLKTVQLSQVNELHPSMAVAMANFGLPGIEQHPCMACGALGLHVCPKPEDAYTIKGDAGFYLGPPITNAAQRILASVERKEQREISAEEETLG